jgi:outer membrane receptor for ferrienterochelin and colicins
MCARAGLFVLGLAQLVDPSTVTAQATSDTRDDSLLYYEIPAVVVTATRGERQLRNVPVSTEVLMNDDIEARGSDRLTDLLAEQAGISIVHEFGAGLQMQGLSSDYILILIDGEPVIGRSGGTLDLDRLTVRGLERIEIVRGPSSSLYGSDALAGVVNLITRQSREPIRASVGMKYETHSTADVSLSSDFSGGRMAGSILLDRYSSDGYDLFPDKPGQTAPGFVDYTASGRVTFDAGSHTKLRLGGRFGRLDQKNEIGLSFADGSAPTASVGERTEWNVTGGIHQRLSSMVSLDGSGYVSRFISTTALETSDSRFDHVYGESELKLDAVAGASHLFTAGAGIAREHVEADRVVGGSQTTTAGFGYLQYQWTPSGVVNFVASGRYDAHSDYESRLSPKLSVLYKPAPKVHVRASIGSGFKAPTFQQRYLDFNNPIGGYRVLGATGAAPVLADLKAAGEIRRYIASVDLGESLRPEHSWSFNVGADWYPSGRYEVRVNLFYNRITDLIETLLVAEQVSGQQIFSYANLDRIRTRGAELNLGLQPLPRLRIDLGYQLLDAADLDVLDEIDAGTVYRRVNGRDRLVTRSDYGGLFQRSRHSASMNLRYRFEPLGMTASVRGTLKGRYGLYDLNGNLILDDDREYVSTHTLWNVTLTQRVNRRVSLQLGVKNLFDHTNPDLQPALPGRLLFAGIELQTD